MGEGISTNHSYGKLVFQITEDASSIYTKKENRPQIFAAVEYANPPDRTPLERYTVTYTVVVACELSWVVVAATLTGKPWDEQ